MLRLSPQACQATIPAGAENFHDRHAFVIGSIVAWQSKHFYGGTANTPDTWVPLAVDAYLKPILGCHYRRTLDDLLAWGVIECDDQVKRPSFRKATDGKCRYYRLTAAWAHRPLVEHALRDRQLRANLARHEARRREAEKPIHAALRKWVAQLTFATPDSPTTEQFRRLSTGAGYFSVDRFAGRVHTPATVVPRQYRHLVRFAGHGPLVCVDVACAQPLLLAITSRNPTTSYIPAASPESVFDRFQQDCQKGILYDRLCAETGFTRKRQKQRFLAVIYGDPKHWETSTGRALDRLYPGLLDALRAAHDPAAPNALVRRLQRAEVVTMIEGAAHEFTTAYPSVPLLTVHDALVVPAALARAAARIVRSAWQRLWGAKPKVRLERWG